MNKQSKLDFCAVACLLFFAGLSSGCKHELRPIEYGTDNGSYCRMTIVEPRFAGAILTDKGRTLPFDALECMTQFVVQKESEGVDLSGFKMHASVNDDGELYPVSDVYFVISDSIRTPMGGGIVAYDERQPGSMSWDELLDHHRRPESNTSHH